MFSNLVKLQLRLTKKPNPQPLRNLVDCVRLLNRYIEPS